MRDQCDAEDEESDAFWDTLVCGMGWTETRLDYEQDPDGKILIERVDPLEMYWDPAARKRNLDDARYVIRVRLIDEADFEQMWPGRAELLGPDGATGADDAGGGGIHIVDPATWYEGDGARAPIDAAGKYRVIEYQWREHETFWRLVDPATRRIAELSDDSYRALERRLEIGRAHV